MRLHRRLLVLLAALIWAGGASAQTLVTEILPLQYRSVDEVVSVLRPLVPPPGVVTGLGDQLILKTTPASLAELRTLLAELDRPPRRLLITVSHADREARRDLELGLAGPRTGVRTLSTQRDTDEITTQQIQVLEGREAYIEAGQAIPLGERSVTLGAAGALIQDTVRYQDVSTGFYVVPRVSGERVTLEIAPRSARLSPRGGGAIDIQTASTVVSGRLGEWLEIGGTLQDETRAGRHLLHSTHRAADARRTILLRVEELP